MLDILYLVPNLADAAVWRRVRMMEAGGALVRTAGFRRTGTVVPDNAPHVVLGQTHDSRFVQRLLAVAEAWPAIGRRLGPGRPDVIVARNLEMLALAHRVAAGLPRPVPVVYECLDIHRLLLRDDAIGRGLRAIERRLAGRSALLLTSSAGFVREYFERISGIGLPVMIVENKVFGGPSGRAGNPALGDDAAAAPIRIGWCGALRCRVSLNSLSEFTRATDGRFEVVLRGRTSPIGFDDFMERVGREPHVHYEGPYRSPEDLAAIYGAVHFNWAIDFYEEGQNSRWLLPNRLYEGCLHGAIPIAVEGTETAAWLRHRGLGVILPDARPETLLSELGDLTLEEIRGLARGVRDADEALFRCSPAESNALVAGLGASRRRAADGLATVAA